MNGDLRITLVKFILGTFGAFAGYVWSFLVSAQSDTAEVVAEDEPMSN